MDYISERCRLNIRALSRIGVTPSRIARKTSREIVWEISLSGGRNVFTSITSNKMNDSIFVVHVDTERFYRLWLKDSSPWRRERRDNCPLRKHMPLDDAYDYASVAFSNSQASPIPLAEMGCGKPARRDTISFINGKTRTMWLIANRAPSFPIEVWGEKTAQILNKYYGLDATPRNLLELFGAHS